MPEGVDDPARPSGGNTYDRRVCDGLTARGLGGPRAGRARLLADGRRRRTSTTSRAPCGGSRTAPSCCSTAWSPHARPRRWCRTPAGWGRSCSSTCRWGTPGERAVLEAAAAIVTTSAWSRRRLRELYGIPGGRIHVAEPGVDDSRARAGNGGGRRLLCVAAVTPGKGHDVLLDGLAAGGRPAVGLRVRGQPRPRPGVRRGGAAPRAVARAGAAGAVRRAAYRRRARPRVRARPTCSCSPRTPRPTAWSSQRRWRAACRCSPPASAGCPRRSGTARTAHGRGCWSRPATRRRSPRRCGAGWWTTGCAARLRRAARERRAGLRPWAATAADVAGALAAAAEPRLEGAAR